MEHKCMKLPDTELYAGSTETLGFYIYDEETKERMILTGCGFEWRLISYSQKYGNPVLVKQGTIATSGDGNHYVSIKLKSTETKSFNTKYIQQLNMVEDGETFVVAQGLINFIRNIGS